MDERVENMFGVHILVGDLNYIDDIEEVFIKKLGFRLVEFNVYSYDHPELEGYTTEFLSVDLVHPFFDNWKDIPILVELLKNDNWNATDEFKNKLLMQKLPPEFGDGPIEVIANLRKFVPKIEDDYDWFF
jgi:hypothetical protein